MAKHLSEEQYVAAARRIYGREGEIEIDDKAPCSYTKGNPSKGRYVQAWVWVYDEDVNNMEV